MAKQVTKKANGNATREVPVYTVTDTLSDADRGGYTVGQKLQEPQEVLNYYRMLCDSAGVDTQTLTDERLMAIIRSVKGDNSDKETERLELIEAALGREVLQDLQTEGSVQDRQQFVEDITASDRQRSAIEFGESISSEALAVIEEEITVKLKARRGPIPVYFSVFHGQSPETLARIPVPGTPQVEERDDGTQIRHNIYDTYSRYELVDGTKRRRAGSWYGDAFASTSAGKKLLQDLETYRAAKNDGAKTKALGYTSDVDLDGGIDEILSRIQYGIQLLRGAARLAMQVLAMREVADTIGWSWVASKDVDKVNKDTGEGIAFAGKPIFIYQKDDETGKARKTVSLGSFVRYDIKQAIADRKGQSVRLIDLESTVSRDVEPKVKGIGRIKDVSTFQNVLSEFVAYISDKDNRQSVLAILADKKSNDLVLNVGLAEIHLTTLKNSVEKRFNALNRDRLANVEAEAAKSAAAKSAAA